MRAVSLRIFPREIGTLLRILILAFATTFLRADPPASYYDAAVGQTGGPLKQALHEIVASHTVIPYENLLTPLRVIWRDPANPSNILLTYSRTSISATASWNREHLWPRSRGNSDQIGPDDSDLFHVVPTDISVNADRASLYFDESDPGDPNYRIPGHPLAPQTSRDSDSWQPAPEERGDIARAMFYMDVVYDGQVAQTTDMELVSFPPSGSQMGRLNTLLLWNEQDPPDDAERARNDLIDTAYQHNRNPFIDHPEFAAEIWGPGTVTGVGTRPIARITALASSAVESTQIAATWQVSLNQFAGEGGLTISFSMSGTASPAEYVLGGAGVIYDPATGQGSVLIPANFSSAQLTLRPINDGLSEPVETAVATLTEAEAYTVVPDASSNSTILISDAPGLPAFWNFNTSPYGNPLAANTGAGFISFSGWGGTINSFGGSSGNALALVGNGGNGTWIDIHLSMSGYSDLSLNFSTRGTSSGFNSGTWSASADGVTFSTLPGVNTASQGTSFVQRQVNFASLTELTDAPDVTLRYTLAGASSNTGNNRIDELTVTAIPLPTGNALRTVTIAAADASASEVNLDPGTFSVQLNGLPPVGGLDVTLSFANGSATAPGLPGEDYTLTGLTSYDPATRTGHLFFPEGQRAALITVVPVADSLAENPETVIASLVTSANYLIGASNSAIVTLLQPVLNDAFIDAVALAGTYAQSSGSNVGATRETSEPTHYTTGGRSVWWRWTAPADGILEINTDGSNFDTTLGFYTGEVVDSLTQLAVDDDSGFGTNSRIFIRVTTGVTYSIAVDGYFGSSGSIVFALRLLPIPTVNIQTLAPHLSERTLAVGIVRLTLASSLPYNLNVLLNTGGTATAGQDYQTSESSEATSVVIYAGRTSADLLFYPVGDDDTLEKTETISVQILDSENYQHAAPPENRVDLTLEDDSPYSEAWIDDHPDLSPQAAMPFVDGDRDGMPALMEYLTDHDPQVPDGTDLLKITAELFVDPADEIEKMYAAVRFVRRLDAVNIPLALQGSRTLEDWQPGGVFISATLLNGAQTEELLFRSTLPLVEEPHTFYRLRATLP